MRRYTIAIEAQVAPGVQGGVEQAIRGLAAALARHNDDAFQYVYVTASDGSWLAPHIGSGADIIEIPTRKRRRLGTRLARAVAPWAPTAVHRRVVAVRPDPLPNLDVDAVHFATQDGWVSSRPFVYSPHDLLHLHRPSDFDRFALTSLTVRFEWLSRNASYVVALTPTGQRDIVRAYGLPADRVPVIPHAAVVTPSLLSSADANILIPPVTDFILFPGKPWPHKNHRRLFQAVGVCHRNGLPVQLVLTGLHDGLPRTLVHLARRERISDALHPVGHVDESALAALYASARGLIYPSLFEGFGLPLVEAACFRLPLACSDIPALRDVAPAEARYFDPTDTEQIAAALSDLWMRRVSEPSAPEHSWDETAAAYIQLYRRLVGLD